MTDNADARLVALKDHEKRELVNRLTSIARTYAHTQQLRARIAAEIVPLILLKTDSPSAK